MKIKKAIEHRIEHEIVVDAYDPWERAMGWFYYLEDRMQFPFLARCNNETETSPLDVGEEVQVLGMPSEETCVREIHVRVRWRDRILATPLSQLSLTSATAATRAAAKDWQYWHMRGYEF